MNAKDRSTSSGTNYSQKATPHQCVSFYSGKAPAWVESGSLTFSTTVLVALKY